MEVQTVISGMKFRQFTSFLILLSSPLLAETISLRSDFEKDESVEYLVIRTSSQTGNPDIGYSYILKNTTIASENDKIIFQLLKKNFDFSKTQNPVVRKVTQLYSGLDIRYSTARDGTFLDIENLETVFGKFQKIIEQVALDLGNGNVQEETRLKNSMKMIFGTREKTRSIVSREAGIIHALHGEIFSTQDTIYTKIIIANPFGGMPFHGEQTVTTTAKKNKFQTRSEKKMNFQHSLSGIRQLEQEFSQKAGKKITIQPGQIDSREICLYTFANNSKWPENIHCRKDVIILGNKKKEISIYRLLP